MKALLPLAAILLAPWAAMAQSSLSYQVITTGTERFCAGDQFLVSPLTPDSFVVRADARVTLWSQSGITLKPGFKASGWNPGAPAGAGFRAVVAPQDCYTYIWKGTVSDAWADAHNWQPLGVPGAMDVAVIQAAPHSPIYIGVGEGVRKLVMDGGALPAWAGLTLRAPLTVGDTLLLTSGIIHAADTAALILADDALALSASDSSYVEGPVVKVGDDAFTFPVGRNGRYRPIGMSAPGSGSAEFRAEYFMESSELSYPHYLKNSGMGNISVSEYWRLDRTSGTDNPKVTLSWNPEVSCPQSIGDSLSVAAWKDTIWQDLGVSAIIGDSLFALIESSAPFNDQQIFAIQFSGEIFCHPTEFIGAVCKMAHECLLDNLYQDPLPPNLNSCGEFTSYPMTSEDLNDLSLKTIQVVVHVVRQQHGIGNWQDTPEVRERILNLFDETGFYDYSVNRKPYGEMEAPIPATNPYTATAYQQVEDTRIRFTLDEDDIYFWDNTSLYTNQDDQCGLAAFNQYAVDEDDKINIFFFGPSPLTNTSVGCAPLRNLVTMFNWHADHFILGWQIDLTRNTLAHELGHTLSLCHTSNRITFNPNNPAHCAITNNDNLEDTYWPDVPGWEVGQAYPQCGPNHFTTNNVMGYNKAMSYFSPSQIAIMHRTIMYTSQFNRLKCIHDESMLNIEQDETWDYARAIAGDLTVKSGNVLTIRCKVAFGLGGRLIVEPGAKLVVDGGWITTFCQDDNWQGIIVLGNPTQNQSWPNSPHQGTVHLLNDAVIEHAKVGIDVIDPDNIAHSGGGVVRAQDATFRNCRKAVAFGPFSRHTNISSFTDVHFLCDGPMNHTSYLGEGTTQFVTMWDTYGINFTDCTFEFDHDNPSFAMAVPKHRWPTGITSHYGGYRLLKGSGDGNRFENLQNGLVGHSLWNIRHRVTSAHSTFTNVYRNIDLAGMYAPLIYNGIHEMPGWQTSPTTIPSFGYMGNHNFAYRIYGNTYSPLLAETINRGVVVNGTVTSVNYTGGRVHDNTFNDLFAATQTEEHNLYAQITCNTYDGNGLDWAVNPVSQGYLADQGTMCPEPNQTNGERAGNTFLGNSLPYNVYGFNLLDQSVYYAAGGSNANTVPTSVSLNIVSVEDCDMSATDPSCEPSSGGLVEYWDSQRRASNVTWSGKMADLDSLVAHLDSSKTQLMLDTIANLHTNDTVLRTVLLAHTPLSDTVLMAYLDRDTVITTTNFEAVMLANLPASHTVWGALTAWLDGKGDKWPDVADTLRWAQRGNPGVTTATSLNREIRYHGGRTHQYADEVVLHYIENDEIDSAKAYMDTVGLYTMRLALLGTELSDGNWDEADSSLVKLPLKTVNDTAVYDLFAILIALGRDTLTILDMSSADSLRVQLIAADTTLDAAVMAKGILSVLLDTMYIGTPEEIPLAPSAKHGEEEEAEEEIGISPTEARYFKAYPNPFTNEVTIEYDLKEDCNAGCFLRLVDIQGRIVFEQRLVAGDSPNRVTFDMGRYETGMYICSLYKSQRLLQTSRLIRVE